MNFIVPSLTAKDHVRTKTERESESERERLTELLLNKEREREREREMGKKRGTEGERKTARENRGDGKEDGN